MATPPAYDTREGFLALYAELRDELVAALPKQLGSDGPEAREAAAYVHKLLDYNVPGGKLNRGLTVVHTLQAIEGSSMTPERARKAAILGWCIEWLQAFFLVADDIMDASTTRRGSPCWYRVPHVGMIAINDAFLMQAHLFALLKTHFRGSPEYPLLLELFNDTTAATELGQLLDLTSAPLPHSGEPVDLDRFTITRYELIVRYKTAFYSFHLPVACGLILAGHGEDANHPLVRDILLRMGEYFQVQDDYLDAYADAETLGKVGTDIEDSKCSWLVVQALARADAKQRETLNAHYGRAVAEHVAAVKALYVELQLETAFFAYEAESHAALCALIKEATAATRIPEAVFKTLLGKIYQRSK